MELSPQLSPFNLHISGGIEHFIAHDPQLSRLSKLPYSYDFPLIHALPHSEPGIYSLSGGRQVGKSTLIKLWMAHLMRNQMPAKQIIYTTGDLIDDHHQLLNLLSPILEDLRHPSQIAVLIIDEITYVKDWDRTIKFLADSGQLENIILMLTDSDMTMLDEARMRFPGRRGKADQVDFHLYPLSFAQTLQLKYPALNITTEKDLPDANWHQINQCFEDYLKHGGYLTAINDLASFGAIKTATYNTYVDWIRGDLLKRGKTNHHIREVLSAIIKHYGSQVTWQSLVKSLTIDHHQTVSDYLQLLSRMDALFIQYALMEDKLLGAPKKSRKVFFTDPFVLKAVQQWLAPENTYEVETSLVVETLVVNHFRRKYPTFYIKSKGEVDIAYVENNQFWPIEIKWRNQIHPKDLKQISQYKNGVIWSKNRNEGQINHTPVKPLLLELLKV